MILQTFSVETIKRLIALDVNFYREVHHDLCKLNNEQLYQHYATYGYSEGRVANSKALRENFFNMPTDINVLEIGPFLNPVLRGSNVKYFDILNKEELIEKAINMSKHEQISKIPIIDFVSKDGCMNKIYEKFDVVISSHNLEHQPDLISHINQVYDILVNGGVYKIVVPNCSYCFDANLPASKISDVIHANRINNKKHSIAKVIEHRSLTSHNDSYTHWRNSFLLSLDYVPIDTERVRRAINEFDNSNGKYIDVHAWQFLPHTLSDIIKSLILLGFVRFEDAICYGPVFGRNEFCIELIKK
ncbi:hypothetical protein [Grimontia hollisae]|uniref:Methyltransferase domain n=1 Tax=Grimontia hollisae TaxID=673 RepID=A0A377HMK9_GRIHO|nr:hypothetical protein [Grimontia hollisae]STO57334.1 Uncharacterised protein [Grimontia hollisae]